MYPLKAVYKEVQVTGKTKKIPIVRGGPIPPGPWRVYPPGPHEGFKKEVCVLDPQFTLPNNRSGFLIHSQGDMGSDGCIVLDDNDFDKVMAMLKKSAGGHLQVCESMEDGHFV